MKATEELKEHVKENDVTALDEDDDEYDSEDEVDDGEDDEDDDEDDDDDDDDKEHGDEESSPPARWETTRVIPRSFKTLSLSPSPLRDSIPTPGVLTLGPEVTSALSTRFDWLFDKKALIKKETSTRTQDIPIETNIQGNIILETGLTPDVPIVENDAQIAPSTSAQAQSTQTETTFEEEAEAMCIDDDEDENDIVKRLEDILSRRFLSSKSHHSTTHSQVEVQSVSAPQLVQELADLLKLGVNPVMASEDKKQKLLSLLDQLDRNKHLLNLNVQHVVQELTGFVEYLPIKLHSLDQTISNHQQLLEKKGQLMMDLARAKKKRSKLTVVFSTTQQNINQNKEKIAELEKELQILKQQQSELQVLIGDCVNQEQTLKEDCQRWVVKGTNVMQAIQDLAPAFEAASIEKKKIVEAWESFHLRLQ